MDLMTSICIECGVAITYHTALLLPRGGGVCFECGKDYDECEECHSFFPPTGKKTICDFCTERIFVNFI